MIHAILTGEVHVGKTTVCRAVVHLARQRGYCVRGILTPTILDEQGERLGVAVVDLTSGEQRTLARCRSTISAMAPDVNSRTERGMEYRWNGPRMGDYCFDSGALQWGQGVIVRAIATSYDLLVLDEIGRLELERSTGFNHALDVLAARTAQPTAGHSLLVVRKPLLPTFRLRLPDFNFVTFEVTMDNRDTVAPEIIERLFPH